MPWKYCAEVLEEDLLEEDAFMTSFLHVGIIQIVGATFTRRRNHVSLDSTAYSPFNPGNRGHHGPFSDWQAGDMP